MRVRVEGQAGEIDLGGPPLGRGGEATVYAVPGRGDVAAKVYHNPTDEQAGKLAAMLAAPPVPPPPPGGHTPVAWPLARLLEAEDDGRVVGCLVPRLDDARLIWEVYNPGVRREVCPHFDYGTLVRTAASLAAAVRTLHECGYVVGDLNESNVLVTPQGLATLIDADSFQVPGPDRLYRCRVGRPEYTPPELQGAAFAEVDRLPQHDAFALAVLVFQLLMQGVHPFAGTRPAGDEPDALPARIAAGHWPYSAARAVPVRPAPHAPPWCVLPPSVQELLRRCFDDAHAEPDLRPTAAEWQQALEQAVHELTTCPADGRHLHPRGLDRCPWCRPRRDVRPPAKASATVPPAEVRKPVGVNDPLPPRPRPADDAEEGGAVEVLLHGVGAGLERRGWLVWLGVALIGAVAGVVYALQHALDLASRGR